MNLLTKYDNGNYRVFLFDDGTKIRATKDPKDTEFHAEFPENIDVKITNKCSIGCPFCHENSLANGKQANFNDIIKFIRSLNKGTELAIGGGGLSTFNDKSDFFNIIIECVIDNIYPSITLNQMELENNPEFLESVKNFLTDRYIRGLGISFVKPSPLLEKLASEYPDNVVIHTINGITKPEDYEYLAEHHFKVLILGYKDFRRGHVFKKVLDKLVIKNQEWLENNILSYAKKFKTVSFDNLAVEQLRMKDKISEEEWNKYYMGDDGQFTMYVDLVAKKYALNSTAPEDERKHLLKSVNGEIYNIRDMFLNVQKKGTKCKNY